MTRLQAVTIAWCALLGAIVLLAAIGLFAAYMGVPVRDSGLREAISGLVALLGVALAARFHNGKPGAD